MNTTHKTQPVNGAEDLATCSDASDTTFGEEVRTTNLLTTPETSSDFVSSAITSPPIAESLKKSCNDIFIRIEDMQRKIARPEKLIPKQMADLRSEASGYYGYLMAQLGELKIQRAEVWQQLKEEYTTDTSTQRAWEATEAGQLELRIETRKKPLENMSSVLRSSLEIAQSEMRNQI